MHPNSSAKGGANISKPFVAVAASPPRRGKRIFEYFRVRIIKGGVIHVRAIAPARRAVRAGGFRGRCGRSRLAEWRFVPRCGGRRAKKRWGADGYLSEGVRSSPASPKS
jgi:hypothetical protein